MQTVVVINFVMCQPNGANQKGEFEVSGSANDMRICNDFFIVTYSYRQSCCTWIPSVEMQNEMKQSINENDVTVEVGARSARNRTVYLFTHGESKRETGSLSWIFVSVVVE